MPPVTTSILSQWISMRHAKTDIFFASLNVNISQEMWEKSAHTFFPFYHQSNPMTMTLKIFLIFLRKKKNIITSTQLNFPVCWRWANVSNRIFIKFQNRCIFIMIIRWWLNQECWCRRSLEEGNWMMMWIRRVFDAEMDKSDDGGGWCWCLWIQMTKKNTEDDSSVDFMLESSMEFSISKWYWSMRYNFSSTLIVFPVFNFLTLSTASLKDWNSINFKLIWYDFKLIVEGGGNSSTSICCLKLPS